MQKNIKDSPYLRWIHVVILAVVIVVAFGLFYRNNSDETHRYATGVQLWDGGPYWAECNIGADKPEECGYYFWWGDTVGCKRNAKNDGWSSAQDGSSRLLEDSNCPTYDKDVATLRSLGYIGPTDNLTAEHDAATAHLGVPWRMPTEAEFRQLISTCETKWIVRKGVRGLLVTGRDDFSSKSIFLPAAGIGGGSYLYSFGQDGAYWSSTPTSSDSLCAWNLFFLSSEINSWNELHRSSGQPIRPLRK